MCCHSGLPVRSHTYKKPAREKDDSYVCIDSSKDKSEKWSCTHSHSNRNLVTYRISLKRGPVHDRFSDFSYERTLYRSWFHVPIPLQFTYRYIYQEQTLPLGKLSQRCIGIQRKLFSTRFLDKTGGLSKPMRFRMRDVHMLCANDQSSVLIQQTSCSKRIVSLTVDNAQDFRRY